VNAVIPPIFFIYIIDSIGQKRVYIFLLARAVCLLYSFALAHAVVKLDHAFLSLGSGKTLAFLLPVIEQVHKYHLLYGESCAPNRPLSVIVTPSRELADQIYVRVLPLCGCNCDIWRTS